MLPEVVSASGLTLYPIVGLVIFFIVFGMIAAQALNPRYRQRWQRCARIPLDEPPTTVESSSHE